MRSAIYSEIEKSLNYKGFNQLKCTIKDVS